MLVADTKVRSLEANHASTRPHTSRQAWTAGTVDTDEPPDDDSDHGEWRPLQKAVTMPRTLDDAEPVSLCTCKCKTPNVDFSRSNGKATHQLSHGLCCVCTVFVCLHAYSQVTELYIYLSFQQRSCPWVFGGLSRRSPLRMKSLSMMHSRFWGTLFFLNTILSCVYSGVIVETGMHLNSNRYPLKLNAHWESLANIFYH